MFEDLLGVIVLLWAVPLGYILKTITREELKSGKMYFKILCISCLIIGIILFFIPLDFVVKRSAVYSLFFIAIVSFISWRG